MLALGSLPCLAFGVDERIGLFVGKIDVTTRHLILLTHVSHSKPVCCQRMTHAWTLSILMSFIQVDGLVQTLPDRRICCVILAATVRKDFGLPQ